MLLTGLLSAGRRPTESSTAGACAAAVYVRLAFHVCTCEPGFAQVNVVRVTQMVTGNSVRLEAERLQLVQDLQVPPVLL